ncbi:MAG: dihydrofolate reductase [Bacteroidales bacterium]|nr:dihydrofolate reductase [Bacteroidales bacterium]
MNSTDQFKVLAEQFGDFRILRYQVPGFEQLPLKKKELLYYLYEAALAGRDIIWDQNYRYNLLIRRTLEQIVNHYQGDRNCGKWEKFMIYVKRVWFSNGIHHHNSMDKFVPEISTGYFRELIGCIPFEDFAEYFVNPDEFTEKIIPLIFDPQIDSKRVSLESGVDLITASANNFYEGLTQTEVEAFYAKMVIPGEQKPISYGLNSKLVKENDSIVEKVWAVGGMYTQAMDQIVVWLEKALSVAESPTQEAALKKLVEFYQTGDLKLFDEYCILWLNDVASDVDVVNGFIEVYGDPLGRKATFESVVSIRDPEATRRARIISENAQWFEDNSPIPVEYKKEVVTGISARGIHVVVESGDCSPASPIGINLPNADWIRAEHGSKSVSLINIMSAYNEASKESGALEEFSWSEKEVEIARKWGSIATVLHVDLHEIIGHGSGTLKKGVPSDALKNYASTIEEARADLFALYFAIDPKLLELGLMPELEVGYAEYNSFITGGLMTQLVRVEPGKNIEESHMRNRQLIAGWVYEKGLPENVIEKKNRDGKTFFVINDYQKLRALFGQLLYDIQRIKSEGDLVGAKQLVENYGVKVDPALHDEVLKRWKELKIATYSGFINPKLSPVYKNGKIDEVNISYPYYFDEQMLEYAENYVFLPLIN